MAGCSLVLLECWRESNRHIKGEAFPLWGHFKQFFVTASPSSAANLSHTEKGLQWLQCLGNKENQYGRLEKILKTLLPGGEKAQLVSYLPLRMKTGIESLESL